MLAVVESIEMKDGLSDRFRSLGLARLICCFSGNVRNGRQAQSVLFSLLMKLMQSEKSFILAENSSGEGLLDGVFAILHNFNHKYLCENACKAIATTTEAERGDTNASDEALVNFESVDQDRAACLCALKVLTGLVKNGRNRGVIVSHRFFMPLCFDLLRSSKLPRPHLLLLTAVVKHCDGFVCEVGETGVFQGLLDTVVSRLEQACGSYKKFNSIPASHLRKGCVDFELSDNLLGFLTTYSESISAEEGADRKEDEKEEVGDGTDCISRLVQVIGKILKNPEVVRDSKPVTRICLNLTGRVGNMMAENRDVIVGLMECLRDARCAEDASKCLQELHTKHGLHAFRKDLLTLCEANSDTEEAKEGSTNGAGATKLISQKENLEMKTRMDEINQTESESGKTQGHIEEGEIVCSKKIELAQNVHCSDYAKRGEEIKEVKRRNAGSSLVGKADTGDSKEPEDDADMLEGGTQQMQKIRDIVNFDGHSETSDVNAT